MVISSIDLVIVLFFVVALVGIIYLRTLATGNSIVSSPMTSSERRAVRIIVPSGGSGLLLDANIYSSMIPGSYIVCVARNSPESHPDRGRFAQVNLYLESIHGGSKVFPSKQVWLMVNQEYLSPSCLDKVDVAIVKSRYAERILRSYVDEVKGKTRVVYLGHTSMLWEPEISPKDWSLFVHFAGRSPHKGTRQLIRLWQRRHGFRDVTATSRLVITCRDMCFRDIFEEVGNLTYRDGTWSDQATGLVIHTYLDDKELHQLKARAGVFLCPSLVEGYGHYINEGTANGAVVITTDLPPMNELISDNSFLIQPDQVFESWRAMESFGVLPYVFGKYLPGSKACRPDFRHLETIIDTYLALPDEEKTKVGRLNYENYISRRDEFRGLMKSFLDDVFAS
jgi:hypothetical protein